MAQSNDIVGIIHELRSQPAQTKREVIRGVGVKLTENGIPVVSVHYTADSERDPEVNPQWKTAQRKKYSSQGAWDREQEIIDDAGGGELVFAETLRTWWSKIVVTDPLWRPESTWRVMGGFDHGKTNPTALERAYIDHEGVIYFCGEYYMPGKQVWEKAPEMLAMPDIDRAESVLADPSIFNQSTQEGKKGEEAKAIAQLYYENGVNFLTQFCGNRNDITFTERLLLHWANLGEREPTVRIVCRNFSERPQFGLHPWDCPNLLWELSRTRRVRLTAQQLLTRNIAEGIVDKDNHAVDSCKYLLMTLPEPTKVPLEMRLKKRMEGLDPTSAMIARAKFVAEVQQEKAPIFVGGRAAFRQKMFQQSLRRR